MADEETAIANMIDESSILEDVSVDSLDEIFNKSYCNGLLSTSTPNKQTYPDRNGNEVTPMFVCDQCGKGFKSKNGLKDHEGMVHSQARYVCEQPGCEKKFMSMTLFKDHILYHAQVKQYMCSQCPSAFVHKKDLKGHIKAKHTKVQYVCEKCGKSFPYKESLIRHYNAIHNNKIFHCSACHMSFTFRSNLKRHCNAKH